MVDYIDALADHHGVEGDEITRAGGVRDLMRHHEEDLLAPLLDYVTSRNSVRLLGPREAQGRAPIVALRLDRPGAEVARDLAAHDIMAGGGNFYAVRALRAMGVDPCHGVLRLSFVHYTSRAEIDQLLTALDEVL